MPLLYEHDLDDAARLCFSCAEVFVADLEGEDLTCPECGFSLPIRRYRDYYRYAFYVTRYGLQYREFYDRPDPPRFKPFLEPLGDITTFVVMAAVTGVLGNAAYDGVRAAIKKILDQKERSKKRARCELTPEDIERVIRFVTDYEKGFEGLPEKIRDEITEEIMGDLMAENQVIGMKIMKCMADPTPANKRMAKILSRDLARRRHARQSRKPDTPSWRFWEDA